MNVFVPFGNPLKDAKCLDARRLNKQIIECKQILAAIEGRSDAWKNHPCVLMWKPYKVWLAHYTACLYFYREGSELIAYTFSKSSGFYPAPMNLEFTTQMKRRLYTKDPIHYAQFAKYGTSDENWYVVDGVLRKYINGKRIK